MTTYYVAAGGSNTSPYDTWAKAATAFGTVTALAVAGDVIYVDSTHNENLGATTAYTFPTNSPQVRVVSATNGTTTPAAGATVNTNGNFGLAIRGNVSMYGMTFTAGTTGSQTSVTFTFGGTNIDQFMTFERCTFWIKSSATDRRMVFGSTQATSTCQSEFRLINCTTRLGHASQFVQFANGRFWLHAHTISTASATPTTLFEHLTGTGTVTISSSDLSAATNLFNRASDDTPMDFLVHNCKIPSTIVTGTAVGLGGGVYEVRGSSNAGDNAWEYYWYASEGSVVATSSVYLTSGGATTTDNNGSTVNYSLTMTPANTATATADSAAPLYSPWINVYQGSTGSKTISMKVAHTEAAVLTDAEVWMEIEYLGTTNLPQSVFDVTAPCVTGSSRDIMAAGSNLTDTAEGWTGITGEKTHTLSKTVTISEKGYLRARIGLAKAAIAAPLYVDPQITVA